MGKNAAYRLRRLHRPLRRGATVLVDDTNCFRRIRDGYRHVATRHAHRCRVLWLAVPVEDGVDDAVLDRLAAAFEWPAADEDVLRYRPGDGADAWLRRHFGGV